MADREQAAQMDVDPTDEGAAATEIRRGLEMRPQDGRSREQIRYERLIETVEPSLVGSPDKLPVYLALHRREMVNDTNLFPINVSAEALEDGTIHLTGYVGYRETSSTLERLLHYLGFESIRNDIEVLPSEELGEYKFGLVIAPVISSYSRSEAPRERLTQAFVGDPVYLLRKAENDYYLVQTAEGYTGYMEAAAIRPVNAQTFSAYKDGPQVYFLRDFEVNDGMTVPQGARLKLVDAPGDGGVKAQLPTGLMFDFPQDAVHVRHGEPNEKALKAIELAKQIEGTQYLWGGKGSEGVDCSGLVQSTFKAVGVNLARDAYMQAFSGSLVATRWYHDGLRAGDLMYFLGGNGRITHTAIHIEDGRYIEAAGTVKYGSINPEHEEYSERRAASFCFAKRVLE